MKIYEIMTPGVESISPDVSAREAARKMSEQQVGCLPVIEDSQLVGIITDRDICCRVTATGKDPVLTKVREIMITDVTTCFDDQDIQDAARLMKEYHIRRLAILKRDNSMAGMLSVGDLAKASNDLAGTVLDSVSHHNDVH